MNARSQFATRSGSKAWPVCEGVFLAGHPAAADGIVKPELPRQGHLQFINPIAILRFKRVFVLIPVLAGFLLIGWSGGAQGVARAGGLYRPKRGRDFRLRRHQQARRPGLLPESQAADRRFPRTGAGPVDGLGIAAVGHTCPL